MALLRGENPASWRAVAKDGADLPPSQATVRPAGITFMPGEIYDFEFTRAAAGELVLEFEKARLWDKRARVPVRVH